MNAWITLNSGSKEDLESRARQIQAILAKSRRLSTLPAALRYAATSLLVGISFFVCLALEGVSTYPLFAFMPAIILAAFLFDRKAGYFATVLSALVTLNFLMSYEIPLVPDEAGKLVALAVFILVGVITAYAVEAMRITIDSLAENSVLREEKRELERELFHAQKMEAVGRANSIIAHDFKNILTPAINAAYLFRKRIAPEDDLLELVDVLDNVCRHGAKLTDDIQAFGRKVQAECVAVNLNAALNEARPILRRSIRPSVSLQLDLADGLPEAWLDPMLFDRALVNIVHNAADAMPEGGTITIRTSMAKLATMDFFGLGRCAPGDYICLAVMDTGNGVPPEVKARMFEPFFTTKPCGQGTGLGMAMVADFVRHAQGCVSVDSRTGAGTTVKLFLPPRTPLVSSRARPAGAGTPCRDSGSP